MLDRLMIAQAKTSNNIIQKGLAFLCKQSGSVTSSGRYAFRDPCPAGSMAEVGLRWWRRVVPQNRRRS
jgi:hypothetical protein